MNLENFKTLTDWLEAGAPERAFSMNHGTRPTETLDECDLRSYPHVAQQLEKKEDCGSVCCLGGYAYQQETGDMGHEYLAWDVIQGAALDWLGLSNPERIHMIALFEPDYAPEHCTPEQAALAVKDFIANSGGDVAYNPWENVE